MQTQWHTPHTLMTALTTSALLCVAGCGESTAYYAIVDGVLEMPGETTDHDMTEQLGPGDVPVSDEVLRFDVEGSIVVDSSAEVARLFSGVAVPCERLGSTMDGMVIDWEGRATEMWLRAPGGAWVELLVDVAEEPIFRGRADIPAQTAIELYIEDPSAVDFLLVQALDPTDS